MKNNKFLRVIVCAVAAVAVVAVLSIGLVACDNNDNGTQYSDTLIVGTLTTVTSLNRLDASSGATGYNYDVLSGTVSQMAPVTLSTDGEFCSSLCTYTSSSDATVWTFSVKDGYTWHDGVAVTGADVAFTFESNLTVDVDYTSIVLSEDGKSAIVTLSQSNPRFLNNVVVMRTMPKHLLQNETKDTLSDAKSVVGCGPFKFVKYDTATGTIEFAKYDAYPDADKISFNKVIFKQFGSEDVMHLALTTGDIDTEWSYSKGVSATYEKYLSKANGITLENYAALKNPMCLFFNNQTVDLDVRKAIAKAIDYAKLRRLFGTTMTTASKAGFVPAAAYGSIDTDELVRDLDGAKSLLQSAGYTSQNKYEFNILCRSDNASAEVAKIIKTDLEETGLISVTTTAKEAQSYLADVRAKMFTAHLGAVTAFGMNNQGGLGSMYMPTTSSMPYANIAMVDADGNPTAYANVHAALSSATSESEYLAAAKAYQEYFVANVPAVSLFNDSVVIAHSSSVSGFVADGTFGHLNIKQFETLKKIVG